MQLEHPDENSRSGDFEAALRRLDGLPQGGAETWKQRYTPLIDEIVGHERPDAPEISVVVVAWQSPELIDECLRSMTRQDELETGDVELIVVDNGGMEPAREVIARYADVEIRMRGNARLCRARNTAVAHARGQFVAFIDDDGVIRPDYLNRALRYFRSSAVVAVRSKIVARHHPYLTALASHYDRGARPVEDCLVTEGSSVVRRAAYLEAGGFAESLAGHEGIDLTYRLKQLDPDYRVMYAPDVVMAHDYYDGWEHFLDKSLSYTDIGTRVREERPELGEFIDSYFQRRFPPPEQSAAERWARRGLGALRSVLQFAAKAGLEFDSVRRAIATPVF